MPNLHVKPGPPLSRFVELLWYYEHPPRLHQKERLMPDGCISLIINLEEDETRLYDADDVNNHAEAKRLQRERTSYKKLRH